MLPPRIRLLLLCAAIAALPASKLRAGNPPPPSRGGDSASFYGGMALAARGGDFPHAYSPIHFAPRFGGFHGAWGVVLIGMRTGAAVDADLLAWGRTERPDRLGLRVGACWYSKGNVGGRTLGSPYTDLDLLLRGTVAGAFVRMDLVAGMTRHFTSAPEYVPISWNFHYGLDLRFKLVGDAFGLMLQFHDVRESGYAGVSIFLAWDRP
jgi:hypothetical protein